MLGDGAEVRRKGDGAIRELRRGASEGPSLPALMPDFRPQWSERFTGSLGLEDSALSTLGGTFYLLFASLLSFLPSYLFLVHFPTIPCQNRT